MKDSDVYGSLLPAAAFVPFLWRPVLAVDQAAPEHWCDREALARQAERLKRQASEPSPG